MKLKLLLNSRHPAKVLGLFNYLALLEPMIAIYPRIGSRATAIKHLPIQFGPQRPFIHQKGDRRNFGIRKLVEGSRC